MADIVARLLPLALAPVGSVVYVLSTSGSGRLAESVASTRERWMDVASKRARRRRLVGMAADMEENLSMLVRRARSGKPSLELIRAAADEGRGTVLAPEMRRVLADYSVGVSLGHALRKSHERVPEAIYGKFISAVALSGETGGDLSHGLSALERVVRERRELRGRVREETAQARYSAIIVAAIPAAAAAYGLWGRMATIDPLLSTPVGRTALVMAASSWALGILFIRRILGRAEELCP